MKVLAIISTGYVAGGAENTVVKLIPYLSDKGYSTKVLASDLRLGPDKQPFCDYTFKSIGHNPLQIPFFLFSPYSFFALRKILKEYKPDIIHLHTQDQVTPSALFLLKKYPTVMTLHGPESFLRNLIINFLPTAHFKPQTYDLNIKGKIMYFFFNSIQKLIYRLVLKNIEVFIAPSKSMQNIAKCDVSPIIILPNFIELRDFHELKNNYNLLFVGRLVNGKGVEFLIQALPLIIQAFPQTTLTIIGDGPEKANLLALTQKLQLEESIQFSGWVENKDLDFYYRKASIAVVPSTWAEAFGIVILEAMNVGRPVIGTNIGSIPEIIEDGVNGYLVEPKNSEQIAEKVLKLFSDEKLLQELGNNARKNAEQFSIEKHVARLEKIYQDIISKYQRRGATHTN